MPIPIIVAVGSFLVSLAMACGSEKENSETRKCKDPSTEPSAITKDPEVAQEAVDYYAQQLPQEMSRIENFFDFKSAWRDSISMQFLKRGDADPLCPGPVCAKDTTLIARSSDPGGWNATTDKAFLGSLFLRVLSQASRTKVAAFPEGLEEGLALYTEIHLAATPEASAKKTSEVSVPVSGLDLLFPLNQYFSPSPPLIFYFETQDGIAGVLRTYERAFYATRDETVFFRYFRDGMSFVECDNFELRRYEKILIDDGIATLFEKAKPYVVLDPDARAPDTPAADLAATGFCFWDTLRERHGHEKVVAIVHSLLAFSSSHQDEQADFPFFEAFREATGMNETDARQHFERFSLSPDIHFPLGGICLVK